MTGGIPQRGRPTAVSRLKLDAPRYLQPVQLRQEWRDTVLPRCRSASEMTYIVLGGR